MIYEKFLKPFPTANTKQAPNWSLLIQCSSWISITSPWNCLNFVAFKNFSLGLIQKYSQAVEIWTCYQQLHTQIFSFSCYVSTVTGLPPFLHDFEFYTVSSAFQCSILTVFHVSHTHFGSNVIVFVICLISVKIKFNIIYEDDLEIFLKTFIIDS